MNLLGEGQIKGAKEMFYKLHLRYCILMSGGDFYHIEFNVAFCKCNLNTKHR